MDKRFITEILDEGLQEEGTIEKAFDYLLGDCLRDIFKMNDHRIVYWGYKVKEI